MQRVNDFWFYRLGYTIHALLDLNDEGVRLADAFLRLKFASDWLAGFMDKSDVFQFVISLDPAKKLKEFIDTALIKEPVDYERQIPAGEIAWIKELVKDFETVTSAEVTTFNTYYVVRKLAYDTRTLLESGELLLPEDVRRAVSADTLDDLQQAAKCMALEVNTAAGFHTIRATESVIRLYYGEVVGVLPTIKDRNWGAYIRILRAKGADPRVTGFLDHIRESYRNPITHPEQRLNSNDSQVLLGVCLSAIIQMVGAITAIRSLALGKLLMPHYSAGVPE